VDKINKLIFLPAYIQNKIMEQMEKCEPEEACGLLSGTGDIIMKDLEITNILHQSDKFKMDGKEMLGAFSWMEQNCQELLAIYHSHPLGPAEPSETDINEDYYPEVVKIIGYKHSDRWVINGFIISNAKYVQIPILIIH
jgi:proteasome lid subunit RPN8/RPN11